MTDLTSLLSALSSSGVSANAISSNVMISYDVTTVEAMKLFTNFFFGLIFVLIAIFFISWAMRVAYPRSKEYRELLANMYVAGKIKQIAKEDNIDLNEELKEYAHILKKTNLNVRMLDNVVEAQLNEKIVEDSSEKIFK